MADVIHRHPVTGEEFPNTGVSGCASSGKSMLGAVYGLVNWMSDPINTMVLMTSTSLKESGKRIWGHAQRLWTFAPPGIWPGRMVSSLHSIFTIDPRFGPSLKIPEAARWSRESIEQ